MTAPYSSDKELFELLNTKLFSGVIGDVLDKLGYLHQFLPEDVKPLSEDMVLAGRAMPVLEADVFDGRTDSHNPMTAKPFGLMLEALDSLKAGEIYVAAGGSPTYARFGELMSTRASILGARGALVDGPIRDVRGIKALEFPAFGRGVYSQDQGPRGQVVDFGVTVEFAGIRIEPGTLIYGDLEGVIVVPKDVEEECIRRALEKAAMENQVEDAIRQGMSTVEAFETFGVM